VVKKKWEKEESRFETSPGAKVKPTESEGKCSGKGKPQKKETVTVLGRAKRGNAKAGNIPSDLNEGGRKKKKKRN